MRIFNYHISHLSACKQTLPSRDSDTYYTSASVVLVLVCVELCIYIIYF